MKKFYFLGLVFLLTGWLQAGEWNVDISKKNQVKFISSATVLVANFEFEGLSDKIDGYLFWEGETPFTNSEFYFEADLNAFETGIKKRDQDMREVVLETNKWPNSSFKGKIDSFNKIDTTVTAFKVAARGTLSLHGVNREIEAPGRIVLMENSGHVTAHFSVLLTDYNIEIPSILVAKVANQIDIKLEFYLKKAASK